MSNPPSEFPIKVSYESDIRYLFNSAHQLNNSKASIKKIRSRSESKVKFRNETTEIESKLKLQNSATSYASDEKIIRIRNLQEENEEIEPTTSVGANVCYKLEGDERRQCLKFWNQVDHFCKAWMSASNELRGNQSQSLKFWKQVDRFCNSCMDSTESPLKKRSSKKNKKNVLTRKKTYLVLKNAFSKEKLLREYWY